MTDRSFRWRLLWTVALLSACSDPPGSVSEPPANPPGPPPELPPPPALPPSPARVSAAAADPAAANIPATYVSLPPGSETEGVQVTVRNRRSRQSIASQMWNGGFDPLPLAAREGDTLVITLFRAAGDSTAAVGVVPSRSRPSVVRTSPVRGRTDVPLNALIDVVFSQPMDNASVSAAVHLRRQGVDVPGSLAGAQGDGGVLSVRFVPDQPLDSFTTYTLSVSGEARSTDGSPLEAPVEVEFSTQASGLADSALTFVRQATVFVVTPGSSDTVPLVTDAARPAWSPGGRQIAFSRPAGWRLRPWEVCLAGPDGSDVRCVTGPAGEVVGGPAWSADGALVAFTVFVFDCPNGNCGQYGGYWSSLLLDPVTLRLASAGVATRGPLSWSPDGRRIATAIGGAVQVMSPNGSGQHTLAIPLGSYTVSEVAWSPDGRRLGLLLNDENACPWYCIQAVGVVNPDGTEFRVLERTPSTDVWLWSITWTPDGRLAHTSTLGDACMEDRVLCGTDIVASDVETGRRTVLIAGAGWPAWRR